MCDFRFARFRLFNPPPPPPTHTLLYIFSFEKASYYTKTFEALGFFFKWFVAMDLGDEDGAALTLSGMAEGTAQRWTTNASRVCPP